MRGLCGAREKEDAGNLGPAHYLPPLMVSLSNHMSGHLTLPSVIPTKMRVWGGCHAEESVRLVCLQLLSADEASRASSSFLVLVPTSMIDSEERSNE